MESLQKESLKVLEATSRTFYIPISRLPSGLLEAVGSGYLCMRAIDEIEDHPELDRLTKVDLLRYIGQTLQAMGENFNFDQLCLADKPHCDGLPEVTLRLGEWVRLAPHPIAPRVWDATASMAERMAYWARNNWEIHTESDLDRYTYSIAGAIGLLLSDLWAWYDGTQADRGYSVGFGRGLQSVNILRNRAEDLFRGVDFFPDGWTEEQMHHYARRNLGYADAYIQGLPAGPALDFCKIPLALAYATIDVLDRGQSKLRRNEVLMLVEEAIGS
jgi:farnesyl-diphosphate farnesyltransferase